MPAFVSGRWTLGAVGWGAFFAAVWFAGDAIPVLEGPLERFAAIVGAGMAWLVLELARARRALKKNEALLQGIASGADPDSAARAAHELSVLRKRLGEAIAVLRKARFRAADGSRCTVAELPWYMFIGAPGSGKTTALLNAGLRFPLGDPRGERALHGVGGTRNCDWWFTDQAVLLDTAGRYTTQESDRQADATAWLGFLDLLKRSRPRQPLNGLIATLSLDDLVHWNEEEMTRYASHVRERVRELYARLGMRLPVYLLVTKADLLAGFMEFFSELDAEGRAQVWGTTFARSRVSTGLARRFESEFEHLERRLYALLPDRLQDERDLQRRAAIYRFPQQFRGTGPLISAFIERAFGAGWEGEAPCVRGVYFTSGTQEGSPIDRVLATLARSFNLERKVQPPNVGSGKSFFLRRPLHEVVFAEAGLAGVDPVEERRRRSAQALACAGIAAVTLAIGAAWTMSYFGNRQLVAAAEARAVAVETELASLRELRPGDEARLLAALNALRGLQVPPRQGLMLRVGLYQGDKLAAQAVRAYHNALRDALLAHLTLSLEDALRATANREVLEGYVALHETSDAKRIEQAALRIWRLPDPLRADLSAHLRAALVDRPLALPRPRDDALIDQARRKLRGRA
jgi:type VI secretion system protein ImpL